VSNFAILLGTRY